MICHWRNELPSVLWRCWLGGRKGIQSVTKYGRGWWRWALISPNGVVPSRMVSVSASVNLPLHHKVQKFSSGTGSPGWSQKKGRKTFVMWWMSLVKCKWENLTSGRSNLTKGHITAVHGWYSLYCTMGATSPSKLPLPMGRSGLHLIHGSFVSSKSITQTASHLVQPFLQAYDRDRQTDQQTTLLHLQQ